MSKIIEDLFVGNIAPNETLYTPEQRRKSRVFYHAVETLEKNCQSLCAKSWRRP